MTTINSLNLLLNARNKQAVVAAPAGQPQLMPPPGGAPPMDPAMMGGGMPPGMPMDPAMMQGGMPMDPAMMGGAPPMDPAMMQGGMPSGMPMDPAMMGMDPAMMGGGMPPEEIPADPNAPPAMNIEQEITSIKEMLQALMESQIALMQTLGGGMPAPQGMPMDPAMMGGAPPQGMPPGMPMDPAMMPMDPAMMGMDPAMMGMDPAMMQGGMQVTASHKTAQDRELAAYLKSISDLLR